MKLVFVLYLFLFLVSSVYSISEDIVSLFLEDKYDQVIEPLEIFLEENPNDLLGNYFLGLSLAQTGLSDQAIPYLEKSLSLASKADYPITYQIHNDLGWTQFLNGDDTNAVRNLIIASEASNNYSGGNLISEIALNNLGLVYSHNNEFEKSKESFLSAIERFDSSIAESNLEDLNKRLSNLEQQKLLIPTD